MGHRLQLSTQDTYLSLYQCLLFVKKITVIPKEFLIREVIHLELFHKRSIIEHALIDLFFPKYTYSYHYICLYIIVWKATVH